MAKKNPTRFLLTVAAGATIGCSSDTSGTNPRTLGSVAFPCDASACQDAASSAGGSGSGGRSPVVGVVPNPSAGGHPPGSVITPPGTGGTGGANGAGGTGHPPGVVPVPPGAGGTGHPPGVVPVPPGAGGLPFPGIIIVPPDGGH